MLLITELLIGFFGLIFFMVGIIGLITNKRRHNNCTEMVMGKVKNIVKRSEVERGDSYFPYFEYVVNDQTIVKESHYGTSKPRFEVGQEVAIYYNPEKIEDYYVEDDKAPRLISFVFVGIGMLVFIIDIIIIVVSNII